VRKVFFTGTHRVRPPEETDAAIAPLLADYGITRLADVTGLDVIGIPVVMSVRPLAATLSVSQGKGAGPVLARVSAAMEAIELWHAENAVPAPTLRAVPAADLDPPYDVTELEWPEGHLVTPHTRLDWIEATALPDGTPVPVPRAAVDLGPAPDAWDVPGLTTSSNGLASGNTVAEATVHALYEVIERDAVAGAPPERRRRVDPLSVDDPHCADLIGRILAAGCRLEIEDVPNRSGVPCAAVRVWHEDLASTVVHGQGAHGDPAIALSRALTEAAQSRLTQIVGSRDDIGAAAYLTGDFPRPAPSGGGTVDWAEVRPPRTLPPADNDSDTDTAEADRLARLVRDLTGAAPMRVVLADRAEFAVVKTVCPGMRHTHDRNAARPAAGGPAA
jgi:ribosomal protein S12 methylthiotransferase accessory factor